MRPTSEYFDGCIKELVLTVVMWSGIGKSGHCGGIDITRYFYSNIVERNSGKSNNVSVKHHFEHCCGASLNSGTKEEHCAAVASLLTIL